MFSEDEASKDWETKDEEPPQRLQDRWAKEAILGQSLLTCAFCKQPVPAESLSCLYCGGNILKSSAAGPGILKRLAAWCRDLFLKR